MNENMSERELIDFLARPEPAFADDPWVWNVSLRLTTQLCGLLSEVYDTEVPVPALRTLTSLVARHVEQACHIAVYTAKNLPDEAGR